MCSGGRAGCIALLRSCAKKPESVELVRVKSSDRRELVGDWLPKLHQTIKLHMVTHPPKSPNQRASRAVLQELV